MGHDAFEPAEPLRPVIFVEAPLHEQSPGGERPKALDGELMHCGREIERDVRDVRQGTQKAGCEKTGTRMPTLGWVFITLYSSSVSLSGNPAEAASNRENWATRQRWPPVQGSRASDRGPEWIDSSRD